MFATYTAIILPASQRQSISSIIFAIFVKIAKKVMKPKTSFSMLRGLMKNLPASSPGDAFLMAGLLKKMVPSLKNMVKTISVIIIGLLYNILHMKAIH